MVVEYLIFFQLEHTQKIKLCFFTNLISQNKVSDTAVIFTQGSSAVFLFTSIRPFKKKFSKEYFWNS